MRTPEGWWTLTTLVRCTICGKPLTDEVSRKRGIGPDCWAKLEDGSRRGRAHYGQHHDLDWDMERRDVICRRDDDQSMHFNLPLRHVHHSPSGWEWGYEGSGPSDFAHNIIAAFEDEFWEVTPSERVMVWDGSLVHPGVWVHYQAYKRQVVAGIPREGGVLTGDSIREWIRRNVPATAGPEDGGQE